MLGNQCLQLSSCNLVWAIESLVPYLQFGNDIKNNRVELHPASDQNKQYVLQFWMEVRSMKLPHVPRNCHLGWICKLFCDDIVLGFLFHGGLPTPKIFLIHIHGWSWPTQIASLYAGSSSSVALKIMGLCVHHKHKHTGCTNMGLSSVCQHIHIYIDMYMNS